MRIVIRGHHLPGRRCGTYDNVHVALQVGSRPEGLVAGDAPAAEWITEVRVIEQDDERDYGGPAVHGRRGERFLYLTWGEYDGEAFAMFRRAKLMLADAPVADEVIADVELTDPNG
ncbi:MAG TPA: DUF5990 family protein, partial [Jatrophihabitantaceae bacterium]|nr:DUF5990 family protein [Jatrophihabitantaceae bacterium]